MHAVVAITGHHLGLVVEVHGSFRSEKKAKAYAERMRTWPAYKDSILLVEYMQGEEKG